MESSSGAVETAKRLMSRNREGEINGLLVVAQLPLSHLQ